MNLNDDFLYDPDKQYRCTIIRGKAQSVMDDILPAYANIISKVCPCSKEVFDYAFDNKISQLIYGKNYEYLTKNHKKTIKNHNTEIAGKLFGLYFKDAYGIYYESPSNAKLLEDNDQPAFFKNLCLNFQLPNGSQKINTVKDRINIGVHLKPFHFIIALLSLAEKENILLSEKEVGYYVLNSLQVLQGKISVEQVFSRIVADRKHNIKIKYLKGSRDWQHIKEQFNLLSLANLLIENKGIITLNKKEKSLINLFVNEHKKPLNFDILKYDLNSDLETKEMFADWSRYYGEIAIKDESLLSTSLDALRYNNSQKKSGNLNSDSITGKTIDSKSNTDLGREGELYVLNFEKNRVSHTHPRLVNQVKDFSLLRGVGYDIQSVEASGDLEDPEFFRMIEVKSTKRVTPPDMKDHSWSESIYMTRREWMAAKQHGKAFNIYRVYFTSTSTVIRRIINPFDKYQNGLIDVLPTQYRCDFNYSVIDGEYK